MSLMRLYSEPYGATGGLAAEGVINQLGRPNIEPLEVLVREAVQNCWDAKRHTARGISVEIGRVLLNDAQLRFCKEELLVDPPPGLPLGDELKPGLELLYFADYGTDGLGGPTRADAPGDVRDFVDFVLNIGQPPDKDLGGGSFGYGKAAFYIASRARTILIDSLCLGEAGVPERRFIGCGLGENFHVDGRPYTGRHWWGSYSDGFPEPLLNESATRAATQLGLPDRAQSGELGTTIVVVAPRVNIENEDGEDQSMDFIAEALAWNFWPRMIDSPRGARRTMEFRLSDNGRPVRIPNPRTHQRLRDFVEAMDRLREEPGNEDDFLLDRAISALRPRRGLGRIVIKKTPVTSIDGPDRPVPVGAHLTVDTVHHIALMRNAELVVRYLPGPTPSVARLGYAGVFKCAVDVDDAFRAAEPPTHDDWVFRAVSDPQDKSFVKIALERIRGVCGQAAGYNSESTILQTGADVPLGEFADSLAALMPGQSGPGARRPATDRRPAAHRPRRAPGRTPMQDQTHGVWVDGTEQSGWDPEGEGGHPETASDTPTQAEQPKVRVRVPQLRSVEEPRPALTDEGEAVVRYPFELRSYGNSMRLTADVEVMASDGGQVEPEVPAGLALPEVRTWTSPAGVSYEGASVDVPAGDNDGRWSVEVLLSDEVMMRVDLRAELR